MESETKIEKLARLQAEALSELETELDREIDRHIDANIKFSASGDSNKSDYHLHKASAIMTALSCVRTKIATIDKEMSK